MDGSQWKYSKVGELKAFKKLERVRKKLKFSKKGKTSVIQLLTKTSFLENF